MRSFALLASTALLSLALTAPAFATPTGSMAPDFEAKTVRGEDFKLSGQKGKITVLEWTNKDCPFVHKHYDSGNMQATQTKITGEGVTWVSIISSAPGKQGFVDDAEALKNAEAVKSAATHIIRDPEGKIGKMYDAKTTPHMFVIDASGKLVYQGAIDSVPSSEQSDIKTAINYVDQAVTELKQGKPVSVATTRSYGCSVKY